MIDDAARLMLRAGGQLDAGNLTAARHLAASAGRHVDEARVLPWLGGDLTAASRNVLDNVLEQVHMARGLLHPSGGAADAAQASTHVARSRFLLDLLRPGMA